MVETADMTDRELLERVDNHVARILATVRTIGARLKTLEVHMGLSTDEITTKLTKLGVDISSLVTEEQAAQAGELPPGSVAVTQDTLDALGAHVDQLDQAVTAATAGQPVAPPVTTDAAAGAPTADTGSEAAPT
jgi:lambda repressor-like predicted transcriptional regulator